MVIADIGTNSGEYVSFVISDNEKGAYGIGQVLAKAMTAKGWNHNTVGLVTISLARLNGKARTKGFMQAIVEAVVQEDCLATSSEVFAKVRELGLRTPSGAAALIRAGRVGR